MEGPISVENQILDELTSNMQPMLVNPKAPAYKSRAAVQQTGRFRWKSNMAPMVYHPTQGGLVLYERTGGVDEQRLKHLAQPKHSADYGPPSDAPNTLSGASHVCVRNAVSSPDPLIPSMRPLGSDLSMLEGEGSASLALQEARSRKALHSEHGALGLPFGAGTQAKKPTVAARKGAGTSQGMGNLTKRSLNPQPLQQWQAPKAGVGQQGEGTKGGGSQASAAKVYKRHSASLKSDLDKEAEAQRDYMVKQRATMTAPHTFTWGGRFKWQGPKHSTGLQHQVRSTQREPLRLDPCTDD
mmetsp:Transcript_13747/g.37130  ORF Transcript_13747/g.37130 Transcript_13747/m.37130 type:complete len:298 (+) Transcript_13747:97-990(+)|eukprot:CAMPEP_0202398992 /NCGR_PEP_ID=MMETSP1128-20130828/1702_1 /ASSEMBLY_ACC=CAM_ASM_000463 /TAXON_ID=3047 /ORGANISM="Dunaliella tertiolecta, Strain CCMP1320" /LENGTH=297 /DNA_ID=CAMNT_0049002227 /DNA_START=1 /DNA_END=894 /DNA_ORIENTATION=-